MCVLRVSLIIVSPFLRVSLHVSIFGTWDIRDILNVNDSGPLSSLNLANNALTGQYGIDMSGIIALTEALPKW
jgi:hypothetical protein